MQQKYQQIFRIYSGWSEWCLGFCQTSMMELFRKKQLTAFTRKIFSEKVSIIDV